MRTALEQSAPGPVLRMETRRVLHRLVHGVVSRGQAPEVALAEAQQRLGENAVPERGQAAAPAEPVVVIPPPEPRAAPPGATPITFVTDADARVYQALAAQFQREHPDIFVTVRQWEFPPGGGSMGLPDLASGADCFTWSAPPSEADRPLVRDLRPLMDADPRFVRADFPEVLLDTFTVEGATYGLPQFFRANVLYYNRDLLAEAGVAPPTANWTPQDLLAAAQRLTDRAAGRYGFASIGAQTNDLSYLLDRFAARPTGGVDPQQLRFTEPGTLAAIQFYRDLLQSSAPFQELVGYEVWSGPPRGEELVAGGKVALWFDDTFRSPAWDSSTYEFAVAPRPMGDSPATVHDIGYTGGLFITAASSHPEACWRWLSFLTGQSAQLSDPKLFPARYSTAERYAVSLSEGLREVYAAYRTAFERGLAEGGAGALAARGVHLHWLHRAVDRALRGEELVPELELAEERTSQFLACRDMGGDELSCARQADPDYNGWLVMVAP